MTPLEAHFCSVSARAELRHAALTWAKHPTANNLRALQYAATDLYASEQVAYGDTTAPVSKPEHGKVSGQPTESGEFRDSKATGDAPHGPNFWPDSFTLVTASSHHGITSNAPPPPLEPEVAEGFASMLEQVQAMRAHYPPTENGE